LTAAVAVGGKVGTAVCVALAFGAASLLHPTSAVTDRAHTAVAVVSRTTNPALIFAPAFFTPLPAQVPIDPTSFIEPDPGSPVRPK
jgi:hypothetical protein